jgi:bifunctional DNA-binding transcriptional regulator/antitoxin component of YhaV-PrlF toxin-antitoxin module
MGILMNKKTEVRKVDSQGRIVLPLDWRESDLDSNNEVIIIKNKGFLKIIPKKKEDLSKFFDAVEFEGDILNNLEEWDEIENKLHRISEIGE